ncbi:MAG: polyphosphate kinase 2 family protein [Planctomycetaceae bacterium]|nr:polyphosphate kinase 2 family protein [Planctomycetaceae bacterium]
MSKHQITPGQQVKLDEIPTRGEEFCDDRRQAEKRFKQLRDEIIKWQQVLWSEGRQKLLIVLQATDAGGKDSTIRKVFMGVNPQGVKVVGFKAPSTLERSHDYLWRVHNEVPPAGMIGVFNRSHYEDVLVVRVENLVPEDVWSKRYQHINDFERLLTDTGTRILKFYLHISRDEQRERFQDRLDVPEKHYKFSLDDLEKRKKWDAYRAAFEEALTRCSTEWAPWHVIPADQKWYRNLAISEIIVKTLEDMNPQFPTIDFDPASVKIDE